MTPRMRPHQQNRPEPLRLCLPLPVLVSPDSVSTGRQGLDALVELGPPPARGATQLEEAQALLA